MNGITVQGLGVVSPAGWGLAPFREALQKSQPIPAVDLPGPGRNPFRVRQVPTSFPRPACFAHPRLRRSSPIAQYAVAAALEALGPNAPVPGAPPPKLGILYCTMAGCVNYSRRFYDETLKDPATASPLVFPETVFNSPASHLSAVLGATLLNDTLVGDPGTYLQAIALAADWLQSETVDSCLVVAAEELDWIIAEATRAFSRRCTLSAGAGALYLTRAGELARGVQLRVVTDSHPFARPQSRAQAARMMRAEIGPPAPRALLCDGLQGVPALDADEAEVWHDWPGARLSPKRLFGEAFMAATAWQCVAGIDAVSRSEYASVTISAVGCNQQAIAAQFA